MLDTLARPADPFATLNDEQRAVVFHGAAEAPPPLLIVAGAGSGKTTTLAARVARLVLDGADPQRILLLSFSRRAAASLAHRVGLLLHQAAPGFEAWFGRGPEVTPELRALVEASL